jgi:hypothetical protein
MSQQNVEQVRAAVRSYFTWARALDAVGLQE